ncbi:MAG TPA: hypothetical protein VFA48_08940 [Gammaproteobacteria bacterium]|nr:hypothetical protein [Gammaproteobacteria bacterium]
MSRHTTKDSPWTLVVLTWLASALIVTVVAWALPPALGVARTALFHTCPAIIGWLAGIVVCTGLFAAVHRLNRLPVAGLVVPLTILTGFAVLAQVSVAAMAGLMLAIAVLGTPAVLDGLRRVQMRR